MGDLVTNTSEIILLLFLSTLCVNRHFARLATSSGRKRNLGRRRQVSAVDFVAPIIPAAPITFVCLQSNSVM